jgi:DNA polymerase III epsilon subunit-like protein
VIFDIETTGFITKAEPMPRIVEIALLEVDRNCEIINKWQTTLNPETDSKPKALQTHKLSRSMLGDSPKFEDIAEWLAAYLHNKTLIAHNLIDFDGKVLLGEFERALDASIDLGAGIDTLPRNRADRKDLSLDKLRASHGITGPKHEAMSDCEALLELIKKGVLKQLHKETRPFLASNALMSVEPPRTRAREDIYREPDKEDVAGDVATETPSGLENWSIERTANITLTAGGTGNTRRLMEQKHQELALVSHRSISKDHIACVAYSLDSTDEKPRKAREQGIPFIRYDDFINSMDGKDIPAWTWKKKG